MRFEVNLPFELHSPLARIQRETGKSIAQQIREAVAISVEVMRIDKLYEDWQKNGGLDEFNRNEI